MSTPAQEAGLVIGQEYTLKANNDEGWPEGTKVTFRDDDTSDCPSFDVPRHLDSDGYRYLYVGDIQVTPVAEVSKVPGFAFTVGGGMTIIELGKELTAAQVAAVLAAAEVE